MNILLAEDSKVYRHLIGSCLKEWGFDFVMVDDGLGAWDLLKNEDRPTLALLDWVLPGMNGIDLCRRIRERTNHQHYVYTVVLTAKNKKQDLLDAMEAGADDYLVKPFDPPELRARLLAGKRIIDLQTELIGARESLIFSATHDAMTHLSNRAEIIAFLQREMVRARREQRPVAVVLADIDHFKKVNDTLGHLSGDAVLKDVARKLTAELRAYDSVGRYGGEEFLLVLPGCDLDGVLHRAKDIRMRIAQDAVTTNKGHVKVTISMGVTIVDPAANASIEAILERADTALYCAKNNGRNRVEHSGTTAGTATYGSAFILLTN
jgi:two-component system cell cycle response regulator